MSVRPCTVLRKCLFLRKWCCPFEATLFLYILLSVYNYYLSPAPPSPPASSLDKFKYAHTWQKSAPHTPPFAPSAPSRHLIGRNHHQHHHHQNSTPIGPPPLLHLHLLLALCLHSTSPPTRPRIPTALASTSARPACTAL